MNKHLLASLRNHHNKWSLLAEVDNAEKQLWALIHTKGLLHSDVNALFCKVRSGYEKIIMFDSQFEQLQDVEYSLWKLHYKHIDEFRKRTKKSSVTDAGTTKSGMAKNDANEQRISDNHIEGFKSFLSEASQFYQSLISKVKMSYGLSGEAVVYKKGCISATVDPDTSRKCQFLCHRFFVCLGDLARYQELYRNSDVKNHDWSVAVTHYLEATMIWPDSGNPHNQLAVLATYVGDEFLALYRCIRSLAVKEPFPDAWNNLILLLEKNRSSDLHSRSSEAFLTSIQTESQSSGDFAKSNMLEAEHHSSTETKLWSLLIRITSFFFTKSSLDDFPWAFSSMMRELDALMTLTGTSLEAALESDQCMDSARKYPFRTLQVVCVLIFIFQNLVNNNIPERKDLEPESCTQQLVLAQLALMVIFTFMGRLVDRCLKAASPSDRSPLLPPILVFVEWLVGMLDMSETYGTDEKSVSAMRYFFSALSDFLDQINVSKGEVKFAKNIPLWEDYELRGYAPLAGIHELLDFSTHCLNLNNYAARNDCRAWRILNAALKIGNRGNNSRKWICSDKLEKEFFVQELNESPNEQKMDEMELGRSDLEVNEPQQHTTEERKESENQILGENHCVNGRRISPEEEEVILFKPLRRYNSVPLYTSTTKNDPMPIRDIPYEPVPADAASFPAAQSQDNNNPLSMHYKDPDFSKPLKQQFSEASISAGPPSLSAWVINRGNLGTDEEKSTSDIFRQGLNAVEEEVVSTSLTGLSISETEDSYTFPGQETCTTLYSSPAYSAPVPSAPFLPDDAVWLNGIPRSYADCSFGGVIGYDSSVPGCIDSYPPLRGMSSSEWLRQYIGHRNAEGASNHTRQVHGCASRGFGELHNHDYDLIGRWGNRLPLPSNTLYGGNEHMRGKLFHGYQYQGPTR